MVFFRQPGNLEAVPFMKLEEDDLGDEYSDKNEESIEISSLRALRKAWFVCWEYEKLRIGESIGFKDSEIALQLEELNGVSHEVVLDSVEEGSLCFLALLDNHDGGGGDLLNLSQIGRPEKVDSIESMLAVLEGE